MSPSSRHRTRRDGNVVVENYRIVLPIALFLTAITTLLFPTAAIYGGPTFASIDRFVLGLLEGLLLPSAMSGISQLTPVDKRATSSSILIAGCYLGSAIAYISATILFSHPVVDVLTSSSSDASVWPYVFYVNGILSLILLLASKSQFDNFSWLAFPSSTSGQGSANQTPTTPSSSQSSIFQTTVDVVADIKNLVIDTINVGKATISSTSGRAIIAAQIGQGALLYSIASWGPLYIEQVVGSVSSAAAGTAAAESGSQAAAVTAAAAAAAAALIVPQLTQAVVGVGVGTASDSLSNILGTKFTRRVLQGVSGVIPALILYYLSTIGGTTTGSVGTDATTNALLSPVTLFAVAQTISAVSLGGVSVSHLEVAPQNAGSLYALGNVAAAISGSITVNIFGRLLEASGDTNFGPSFLLVATLSATGSIIYATTIQTTPEILVKRQRR